MPTTTGLPSTPPRNPRPLIWSTSLLSPLPGAGREAALTDHIILDWVSGASPPVCCIRRRLWNRQSGALVCTRGEIQRAIPIPRRVTKSNHLASPLSHTNRQPRVTFAARHGPVIDPPFFLLVITLFLEFLPRLGCKIEPQSTSRLFVARARGCPSAISGRPISRVGDQITSKAPLTGVTEWSVAIVGPYRAGRSGPRLLERVRQC